MGGGGGGEESQDAGVLVVLASPDNGLSPGGRQNFIWTIAWILLIQTLGPNFSEILSEIHTFSFKKMYLKMSSVKWWQFRLGLNMLMPFLPVWYCVVSHYY